MSLSTRLPLTSSSSLQFNKQWLDALFSENHPVYLGFSGGIDSHVLLHALVQPLSESQKAALTAIHVHHGLSDHADDWLHHCEQVCQTLGVRFVSQRVTLESQTSIEEAARNARYQAFQDIMAGQGSLLLAHHAGDQAETVLFRLLRGTGGKGLSGIPYQRVLAGSEARLIRPFLGVDKKVLQDYAQQNCLHWVEDESNSDERFTRNFLRRQVMPVLKSRFAHMEQSIGSTAQRLATDYAMLSRFAHQQLDIWCDASGGLPLRCIADKPREERLFWLRHFLSRQHVSFPHAQLESVDGMFFSAKDKQPTFKWLNGRLMRHLDVLYLLPPDLPVVVGELPNNTVLQRSFDEIQVQGTGRCQLIARPQGISLLMPNGHSRKLKKWLNDWQIPSWWRDHLPYICEEGQLVAIGDIWCHPAWPGKVSWQRKPGLPFFVNS
ncbi:tRNA lysidine(34) synthetase TilS [Marinomonas algarum]|uniref:tRNA(Ile)-lysidine synthase n=1 Tax=Marinomonas algarum TaxID=2883105 RepID=A0A9X1ILW3_9GAMM|nr:tRNA lysidine(34) synthetase TilS [Marinomonas algarum]MCB5161662.1 tRNA lysidine(34) synthetase TilS [Marinomonas algarum]